MYVSNATKACALYEEERGEDGRIIGLRKTEEYAIGEKYRYNIYVCGACGFKNKRSIKFPPHKIKSCSKCRELFQDMP